MHKTYGGIKLESEVLVANESGVTWRGRLHVTQVGTLTITRDYPSLGKSAAVDMLCHAETSDGKITRLSIGYSPVDLLSQLGHMAPL